MECLDENAAPVFVAGQMTVAEHEAVEAHVDSCADCFKLIAALAKTATIAPTEDGTTATQGEPARLMRGSHIGRYEIDSLVAVGAMGAVYLATDPDLRRAVALKLVRTAGRDETPERTDRLLREARTMAKLAHPNVVAVHDVGTFEGRVFLAMDFVDGETLGEWLATPRSAAAILAAFLEAGKGLAAAHEAGVVHRDFKPDNVLLGKDGRVLVTDFGLARAHDGDERAGLVAGTPAYMAPEQLRGDEVDPSADQFGFSVALYEALEGERPFAGKTSKEILAAIEAGRIRDARRTPAHVRRALRRGLAARPGERFPSMRSLLDELARDPAAALRRRVIVALVAVVVVASFWGAAFFVHRERAICREAVPAKLAVVWNPERRAAIEAAFRATRVPYADDAFARVARALDAHAAAWSAMHVDACDATHVRAEQSAELLDLRVACLGDRLGEMRALTDVFVHADADVVKNAPAAVTLLTPLAPCADARALREVAPPPADRAAGVASASADVAHAKALRDAGRLKESVDAAKRAVERSAGLGYAPLLAIALLRLGDAEVAAGDGAAASGTLRRAADTADEARDDFTRARALAERLFAEGYLVKASAERIAELDGQASAASARIGRDALLEGDRFHALGMALLARSSLPESQAALERAIVLREKAHGATSRHVAMSLNGLCLVRRLRGDLEDALRHCERAESIWTEVLGANHPDVALGMSNVGALFMELDRVEEGCARFEKAFAVTEAALGEGHPQFAMTLANLGECYEARGLFDRAVAAQARVLAIREKQLGPTSPRVAITLANLGRAYVGLGDFETAVRLLERAVSLETADTEPAQRAGAAFGLARALLGLGGDARRQRARALALSARALSIADTRERRSIDAWLAAHP